MNRVPLKPYTKVTNLDPQSVLKVHPRESRRVVGFRVDRHRGQTEDSHRGPRSTQGI